MNLSGAIWVRLRGFKGTISPERAKLSGFWSVSDTIFYNSVHIIKYQPSEGIIFELRGNRWVILDKLPNLDDCDVRVKDSLFLPFSDRVTVAAVFHQSSSSTNNNNPSTSMARSCHCSTISPSISLVNDVISPKVPLYLLRVSETTKKSFLAF